MKSIKSFTASLLFAAAASIALSASAQSLAQSTARVVKFPSASIVDRNGGVYLYNLSITIHVGSAVAMGGKEISSGTVEGASASVVRVTYDPVKMTGKMELEFVIGYYNEVTCLFSAPTGGTGPWYGTMVWESDSGDHLGGVCFSSQSSQILGR